MTVIASPVPSSQPAARLTRAQWQMVALAIFGAGLDYFDFLAYAIFARYIAAAFFPVNDPSVSIVLTFLVFATGYLIRPLGGMLLSHFGDKYGRRNVFIFALLGVSVATAAVGLLPTYASWGLTATVILTLLRIAQGVSIGGETANALAYVVETLPRRATFVSGILLCSANAGVLLATLINVVLQNTMSQPDIASYGWRIPFLIGGALGLLFAVLRRRLQETPEFLQLEKSAIAPQPVLEVFRSYPAALICGIGAVAAVAAFQGLVFAFMPVYLTNVLNYPPQAIGGAITLSLIVYSVAILVIAWFGDRISNGRLLQIGSVLLILFSVPIYSGLVTHAVNLNILLSLLTLIAAFVAVPFLPIIADLFPTNVRFSGSALSLNVSTGFFGGVAPIISSWLVASTQWQAVPALYLMFCALLSLITTFWLPKHLGHILNNRRQTVG